MSTEPKQQHYVPKCYSKNFVNDEGYLKISDLWEDGRIFSKKPGKAFTAKYMYSQPVYAENRFDNSIEHFLSRGVEINWTPIFKRLSERQPINQKDWGNIVQFMVSMLVRVPITFDAVVELLRELAVRNIPNDIALPPETLAEHYRQKTGLRNSVPVAIKDLIASDIVSVNIDPHCCVTSMAQISANLPIFQQGFSFGIPQVLHNCTGLPFLSSDNPVCFYGGRRDNNDFAPYRIRNMKSFSFVFPISSDMALVNSTFTRRNGMHVDIGDKNVVAGINRIVAKFSYRYVFGENDGSLAVGRKYRNICPRPVFERSLVGNGVVGGIGYKFGEPNRTANSWSYDIKR